MKIKKIRRSFKAICCLALLSGIVNGEGPTSNTQSENLSFSRNGSVVLRKVKIGLSSIAGGDLFLWSQRIYIGGTLAAEVTGVEGDGKGRGRIEISPIFGLSQDISFKLVSRAHSKTGRLVFFLKGRIVEAFSIDLETFMLKPVQDEELLRMKKRNSEDLRISDEISRKELDRMRGMKKRIEEK